MRLTHNLLAHVSSVAISHIIIILILQLSVCE